jgi:two-component system response regulator NreC
MRMDRMNTIKVMIADDHAILRDGIRALLSSSKDIQIVAEAEDGREAVSQTLIHSPNVVLMDISMPMMDGLEATRRIVKRLPTARVIVLTQHSNREYVLAAIKAGAAGYIPKRALGSDLVDAVRTVHRGDSYLYPSVAPALVEGYLEQIDVGVTSYDRLSGREREVLQLVAEGRVGRQIAETLKVSIKTVYGHINHIMKKLNTRNRAELVKYAIRNGVVPMIDAR